MKIFRLTTNYPSYLKSFYISNPSLKDQSYEIQHKTLLEDCFGWANFWTEAFSHKGIEVWEPVANEEYQQKQWAFENGITFTNEKWLYDISFAQIQKFKPEILLINDYHTFSFEFISHIRDQIKNLRLIIGWCGAPIKDTTVLGAYDIILTNLPIHLKTFSSWGLNTYLMRHAFHPLILNKIKSQTSIDNFSFIGSIVKVKDFHEERFELLDYLSKKTNIKIFSDSIIQANKTSFWSNFKIIIYKVIYKLLSNPIAPISFNEKKLLSFMGLKPEYFHQKFSKSIVDHSHPGLYGLSMYSQLHNSLISLNQHIDIAKGTSNNMRLFEATGVGSCVLTDWSEDLEDIFEEDYEIVCYKSKEELLDKYKYLVSNPTEAIKIGKRGQTRTLRENTFTHRSNWLLDLIQQNL